MPAGLPLCLTLLSGPYSHPGHLETRPGWYPPCLAYTFLHYLYTT